MGDALALVRKATGKRHPDDKPAVRFPRGLEYLWRYYRELEGSRPITDGMMLPIPASEYVAWQTLSGVRLRPWEITTLRAIDAKSITVALKKDLP